jgi:hypothetical protein
MTPGLRADRLGDCPKKTAADPVPQENTMIATWMILPLAAMEYSLIYLLLGGGLSGAILIFIIARMLGK